MTLVKLKLIFLFPFSLLFFQSVFSQYQVKHFSTENGLPSNGIKGLQWDDATGFLWIATEAGIVRYNGMSFKTFDVNTNPDLGSSRIVFALKNMEGKIFVGGEKGNLLTVNENNISTYLKGESTARYNYNYYNAITASDTLFKQCFKSPWNINIFSINTTVIVPLNDTACVALGTGLLYYYSVSTAQPVLIEGAPANLKFIFTIADQLYGINLLGKLILLDVYTGKNREVPVSDINGAPFALQVKNSNLFWQVGMESPVLLQDQKAWVLELGANNSIQMRLVAAGIPQNTFFNYALYKKKGDYLFLGSASKGVYFIQKNQLTTIQPAERTVNQRNSFYSQIELPDGNILTNEGTIMGNHPAPRNYNLGSTFLKSVYALNDSLLVYSNKDSVFPIIEKRLTGD